MVVVAPWCCSLALSWNNGNGCVRAHDRRPSRTQSINESVSLSIRGGIGRIVYTAVNNGSTPVNVETVLQVGGLLKSTDGIGFTVQAHQQQTIGIYNARVFAPFTADLAAGKSLLERTGYIIGVFFYFTS